MKKCVYKLCFKIQTEKGGSATKKYLSMKKNKC